MFHKRHLRNLPKLSISLIKGDMKRKISFFEGKTKKGKTTFGMRYGTLRHVDTVN